MTPIVCTAIPQAPGCIRVEFATEAGIYVGSVRMEATNPAALLVMLEETKKLLERAFAQSSAMAHQHNGSGKIETGPSN